MESRSEKIAYFIIYKFIGLGAIFLCFWFPVICFRQTAIGLSYAILMVALVYLRSRALKGIK